MKLFFLSILFIVGGALSAAGQAPQSIEERLTTLWNEKKYNELRTLLDAESSVTPPDVVALYCAKFFYMFIQPSKAKALAAAAKLKALSEATADPDFIEFANEELAEVQGIPDGDFVSPTPEVLTFWHTEFEDEYPNVGVGVRLRKYAKIVTSP